MCSKPAEADHIAVKAARASKPKKPDASWLKPQGALQAAAQAQLAFVEAVRQGLPLELVDRLVGAGYLTLAEISQLVLPARTLAHRRQHDQLLSPEESDRFARVLRLVYSSSHLSLAALEALVHFDVDEVPEDLRAFAIDIPDKLAREQVSPDKLPTGWTRQEFATRALGDEWLAAVRTPVLLVPSAVIPEETNVLVNPAHPATRGVVVVTSRRFVYDPRF